MNKKHFFILLTTLLTIAISLNLTACGDDPVLTDNMEEEDHSGDETSGNTRNYVWPTWTDIDGKEVKLYGWTRKNNNSNETQDYTFQYNNTGRISHFFGNAVNWKDNNTFSITQKGDNEDYTLSVTLNDEGLVNSLKYTYQETDGDYEEKTSTFSYNANKQLMQLNETGEWSEPKDNESGSYTYTETYTWENGNITNTQYSYKEEGLGDGGNYSESEIGTLTITYTHRENPTLQFPYGFAYGIDFPFEELATLGLFGAGPQKLPQTCNHNDSENSHHFLYTLNPNGTIATEQYYYGSNNQYGYTFTYSYGAGSGNPGDKTDFTDFGKGDGGGGKFKIRHKTSKQNLFN